MTDIPPAVLANADQAYAEINETLNTLVKIIREGMHARPHNQSLIWYENALEYRRKLDFVNPAFDKDIHHHTADIMIAALFRLASQ